MPFDGTTYFNRREELRPYLKCTVFKGMHDREYLVAFTTVDDTPESNPLATIHEENLVINVKGLENRMFVNISDVIVTNEGNGKERNREGLVKIKEIYLSESEKYLVGINDLGDMRISRKFVPNSEIVWR